MVDSYGLQPHKSIWDFSRAACASANQMADDWNELQLILAIARAGAGPGPAAQPATRRPKPEPGAADSSHDRKPVSAGSAGRGAAAPGGAPALRIS